MGVDYGIYLFERMYHYVKYDGLSIEKSYSESLRQRDQPQYLQPWLHLLLFFAGTFQI